LPTAQLLKDRSIFVATARKIIDRFPECVSEKLERRRKVRRDAKESVEQSEKRLLNKQQQVQEGKGGSVRH
jgi:DNA polymerase elongation subunit (family B)